MIGFNFIILVNVIEMSSRVMMKNPGAPRHTLFGLIGNTMNESSYMRSLGGIVQDTKTGKTSHGTTMKAPDARSKTCIPGAHYGQTPYPGRFFTNVGKSL